MIPHGIADADNVTCKRTMKHDDTVSPGDTGVGTHRNAVEDGGSSRRVVVSDDVETILVRSRGQARPLRMRNAGQERPVGGEQAVENDWKTRGKN